MKKLFLLVLPCLILIGGGCSSSTDSYDDYNYDDSYYYDDYNYDDSYDSSYDSYDYGASSVPQGYHDVYACNLDSQYCLYVSVNISGTSVSSVTTGSSPEYPSVSYCDSQGCAYTDFYGDQWYFDF